MLDYEKTALALMGEVMGRNVDAQFAIGSATAAQVFATLQLAKEVRDLRELMARVRDPVAV